MEEQISGLMGETEVVYRSRDGREHSGTEQVLRECQLTGYLNGKYFRIWNCTPQYLEELVIGNLYTSGLIRDVRDITSLSIREDDPENGMRVEVQLGNPESRRAECVTSIDWEDEWVFDLADRLAEGMPLHQATYAAHCAFLSKGGELLFESEDIGRHNAIDKIIGYGVKNQIDLKKCLVYSSGRCPVEIAQKIVMAGIPVFAAKAVPTKEAIAFAKKYHLTLIGGARPDRMKIYHK